MNLEDNKSKAPMSAEETLKCIKRCMRISSEETTECKYAVIIRMLGSKIKGDLYGYEMIIGVYSDKDVALEKAKYIIKETGISTVAVNSIGHMHPITNTSDESSTEFVAATEDSAEFLASKLEYSKQMDKFNKEREIEQEIEQEMINENNDQTMDYYTRQLYLLAKADNKIKNVKDDEKQYNGEIEKILQNVKKTHENFKDSWADHLKKQLEKRDELHIYNMIKSAYDTYSDRINATE